MSVELFSEEYFMRLALKEAEKALADNEIPIGAVMVVGKKVVGRGYNQTEQLNDVTAHAEILALTAASVSMQNKYMDDCTLFVTLEPCIMCAGALAWAQLGRLVFAARDEKKGFMSLGKKILHPKTTVQYGLLSGECTEILQGFFRQKRLG